MMTAVCENLVKILLVWIAYKFGYMKQYPENIKNAFFSKMLKIFYKQECIYDNIHTFSILAATFDIIYEFHQPVC